MAAALYIALYALTLAGSFGAPALANAAALVLAALLVLEFRRVPLAQRLVGSGLCAAGIAACAVVGDAVPLVLEGLRQALPFLVLFAAVLCLQVPAQASPSLRSIGNVIMHQPPGRRYLAVAAGAHLLGALLNLAGLQFVATVVERGASVELRERLARAMMRGFSAAACWSPLFVSTAAVLSVMPGLSWTDIGPPGMVVGAGLVCLAWLVDRLRRQSSPATGAELPRLQPMAVIKVAIAFTILVGSVLTLVDVSGVGIAIALGVAAPLVAVAWRAAIADFRAPIEAAARVFAHVGGRLADLRAEALLFTGASLLGTGVAAILRAHPPSGLEVLAAVPEPLMLIGLVVGLAAFGIIGLHPVVPVIVVGRALPPEALGLPPQLMALALMSGWGLATMVSPFSATAMYTARLLDRSVWVIAWRWQAAYGLGAAALVGAAIAALT